MNVFQVIDESPNGMSAWLIHNVRREENLVGGAEVSLAETGSVFARFRIVHKFRASRIEEDVLYYQDSPRVDFRIRLDWRERGSPQDGVPQLKVSFAGALAAPRVRTEGPFSVAERVADGQEQPTQKWVDVEGEGGGFAIYNDARYGYDALGGRVRVTLVRNGYGPDPEPDNGIHEVALAFEPHAECLPAAELIRRGMAFNRPPLAVLSRDPVSRVRPTIALEGSDSVVCTALRRAEHSDELLVRLFEAGGKRATVSLRCAHRVRAAREVNFLENTVGGRVKPAGSTIRTTLRPYEVKTIAIDAAS